MYETKLLAGEGPHGITETISARYKNIWHERQAILILHEAIKSISIDSEIHQRLKRVKSSSSPLTETELSMATTLWIKSIQTQSYSDVKLALTE